MEDDSGDVVDYVRGVPTIVSGDSSTVEQLTFQLTDGGSAPTSPLQLFLKLTNYETAALCYQRWHYFGDKGFLASYNFGVYFDGVIYGAISYGIPNASQIKGLYEPETQSNFMELTRLALSDDLPKNSESRVIAVSLRMLKKAEPRLKGIITYADTAYGHTGIIYRASNFRYLGLTAPKTDLFLNGKAVGKLKGVRYSELNGEWRKRSQKHLFVRMF